MNTSPSDVVTGITDRDGAADAISSGSGAYYQVTRVEISLTGSCWTNIQLYSGELTENTTDTISTYFYDLPTTETRRNRHIYPSGSSSALRIVNLPEAFSRLGIRWHEQFIYPDKRPTAESEPVESARVSFTIFVVAD